MDIQKVQDTNNYWQNRVRHKDHVRSPTGLHVDTYIAQHADRIHRLKAKDSTGQWAYYFVLVKSSLEKKFIAALREEQSFNLEDFGLVIDSCYGNKPDQAVKDRLLNKYGFVIT